MYKWLVSGFIVYVCLVAIVSLVMIFYYAPKLGQKNVLIYIIICSVVGSLSVMGCKGIGLAIVQTFQGLLSHYYNVQCMQVQTHNSYAPYRWKF